MNKWSYCLVFLLVLFSCRKKEREWQVNVVAPIFQADLSLNDLITDSLLITKSDNSYDLAYVYENTIDSFAHVLQVPDTVSESKVSLQKLILGDQTLIDTIRLREIAPETRLVDGQTVVLPAQDIKDAGGSQEIDISEQFFKSATIKSGFLDIDLHNDLPVEVEILIFKLSNKSDGALIAIDTFRNILPFTSAKKSIDIGEKHIDGVLVGEMIQVKTKESSGPVLVDADKGVRIELRVRELEVEEAIAIFPEQELLSDTAEVQYKLNKAKVTEMHIHRGKIAVTVISTIEEDIILNYTIPYSGKGGDFTQPVDLTFRVPAATKGKATTYTEVVPIDNYTIVYKGKVPTEAPFYNALYSRLTASTVYSGIERTLSLKDSVIMKFGLIDIEPAYAIGEFGDRNFGVKDTLQINAFKNMNGNINLEDARLTLELSNGFGIEADFTLNSMQSINNRNKKIVGITHPIVNDKTLIHRATNPPFTPYERRWVMFKDNSNIKAFIENLPDQIAYDVDLKSQPRGSRDFTDFIFDYSTFHTKLTLDLPVSFRLDSLRLVKRSDFDFSSIRNSDQIISGTFKLKVENSYPIDAWLVLEFLNEDLEILFEAFKGQKVEAAPLKSGEDITIGPELTYLTTEISEADMDLIRHSKYIRVRTMFDTPDSKNHKVYNNYQLKTKLLADFIYEQRL